MSDSYEYAHHMQDTLSVLSKSRTREQIAIPNVLSKGNFGLTAIKRFT